MSWIFEMDDTCIFVSDEKTPFFNSIPDEYSLKEFIEKSRGTENWTERFGDSYDIME
jgi:hypothetical protein